MHIWHITGRWRTLQGCLSMQYRTNCSQVTSTLRLDLRWHVELVSGWKWVRTPPEQLSSTMGIREPCGIVLGVQLIVSHRLEKSKCCTQECICERPVRKYELTICLYNKVGFASESLWRTIHVFAFINCAHDNMFVSKLTLIAPSWTCVIDRVCNSSSVLDIFEETRISSIDWDVAACIKMYSLLYSTGWSWHYSGYPTGNDANISVIEPAMLKGGLHRREYEEYWLTIASVYDVEWRLSRYY